MDREAAPYSEPYIVSLASCPLFLFFAMVPTRHDLYTGLRMYIECTPAYKTTELAADGGFRFYRLFRLNATLLWSKRKR